MIEASPGERRCERCGLPIPAGCYRNKRYCSHACGDLAHAERRRRAKGVPIDRVTRCCEVCNLNFLTKRWNAKYCGPACRAFILNQRRIDKRRKTERTDPNPSPEMIQRLTTAIRANWDQPTHNRRLASHDHA